MPRRSPYEIVLSPTEKRELERIARRYTSPYYLVMRAKIVLLAAQGLDNKTIGSKLSVPRQIVSKWRKRFFDLRLHGLEDRARPGRPSVSPPDVVVKIKALACELPRESGLPLSRYSSSEIAAQAIRRGIVAEISGTTIWRWLDQDAIRPWQFRSWIFPRDPLFEQKAGPVLDLYQGQWCGVPLRPDELIICADEKPSIQARQRTPVPRGPRPRQAMRVEHEYERRGALCYLAAWDVRHAKLFGHCAPTSGIVAFNQLVSQVMDQDPYRSASRVFWIVDNGSSHRGSASIQRLQQRWPNIVVVHLPIHASWLNQIEIYFSIVQRKVLTPNDFPDLRTLEEQLLAFQAHYQRLAEPFEWRYTRADLSRLLSRLNGIDTLKISA